MNRQPTIECARLQDGMAELALERRPQTDLPDDWKAHLVRCSACARYAEGLAALPGAMTTEPLYTAALRDRTLSALAAVPACRRFPLWVVPLGLIVQAAVSLVLPGLLLDRLLESLVHDPNIIFALTSAGLAALGALTALAGIVPVGLKLMKEEGYA